MKLSRNGELPYYLGVFLEITHDATKELLKYNMNDIVIVLIVLIKNILRVMEFSEIEYYPKTMGAIGGGGGGGGVILKWGVLTLQRTMLLQCDKFGIYIIFT